MSIDTIEEALAAGARARSRETHRWRAVEGHAVVIEPRPKAEFFGVKELWKNRELLYFLSWRDVKVRYRQTVLGVLWAVLQPLVSMAIFTVIFGRWAGDSTGEIPYSIFVYSGMLLWLFVSSVISGGMGSVIGSQNLFTKVHFPRLVMPFSSLGPFLIDLGVSLALLLVMMPFMGVWPSWRIVFLPIVLLFTALLALGIGTGLSALTVRYRDFRYAVPFMLQVWFYVSTLVWPQKLLPKAIHWINYFNPLAGLGAGFRVALLGSDPAWDLQQFLLACALSVGCFWLGVRVFRSIERSFADIV